MSLSLSFSSYPTKLYNLHPLFYHWGYRCLKEDYSEKNIRKYYKAQLLEVSETTEFGFQQIPSRLAASK